VNRRAFALLAVVALAGIATPASSESDGSDLYTRMQRINAGLKSYEADLTVAIETHGFPYISPTLQGKAYYKQPDKTAVQFESVPALASQVKKVVVQIEPAAEWPKLYMVTMTGDNGTTSTFKLVRKKNGRIDHVDVSVDDKTATVSGMTYYYKDGGSIAFTQTYDQIGGNYVVKQQSGKVAIPHYNADVTSTFRNYKVNVPVPDSVFTE
jgi:hypothetical protein